jgi:hypothetical protein
VAAAACGLGNGLAHKILDLRCEITASGVKPKIWFQGMSSGVRAKSHKAAVHNALGKGKCAGKFMSPEETAMSWVSGLSNYWDKR